MAKNVSAIWLILVSLSGESRLLLSFGQPRTRPRLFPRARPRERPVGPDPCLRALESLLLPRAPSRGPGPSIFVSSIQPQGPRKPLKPFKLGGSLPIREDGLGTACGRVCWGRLPPEPGLRAPVLCGVMWVCDGAALDSRAFRPRLPASGEARPRFPARVRPEPRLLASGEARASLARPYILPNGRTYIPGQGSVSMCSFCAETH